MSLFWLNTDPTVKLLYLVAVLEACAYLRWHHSVRGYIFSPFTLVVLIYAFTLLVVAPQQFSPEAWGALLEGYSVSGLSTFMARNLEVNLVGFIVMLGVMWLTELGAGPKDRKPPLFRKTPSLEFGTVEVVTVIGIVVFVLCLLAEGGTIPLFGSRTIFDQHTSLRPIYNFANLVILFGTSTLIVYRFVSGQNRGGRGIILVGLVCMLLTGGRTSFLSALELLIVLSIYRRPEVRLGRAARRTVLATLGFVLIAVLGLYLASLRVNGAFSLSGMLESIVYGNTFSDLRDGAFVMHGWTLHDGGKLLYGKTFLAGLLSFLPSSGSSFRLEYSWGYYTTTTLFGYTGHYGFRGGWSLESFLNFGWSGVAFLAAANGWLLGRLERCFYVGYVREHRPDYARIYAFGWLAYTLHTVLIASSATYDIYSLLIIFVGIWLIESLYRSDFVRMLPRVPRASLHRPQR